MKKAEKTFFVQNLTEELKSATSVVLVDYSGMDVKAQQDLKKKLKDADSKMVVVKNTLFKIAAEAAKLPKESLEDTVLSGPVALVITESDPLAPIQTVHKFAKEFDLPNLKVGIIEGAFQDKVSLENLAKLPGKEILFAQVVGAIASPMTSMVHTLNANLQKLVVILDQAKKEKEENKE